MSRGRLSVRLALVGLVIEVAHLTYEHFHGGVVTHHLLRSAAMPGLSNAWGLLLMPTLAFWAGRRIEGRLVAGTAARAVVLGGLVPLLLGLALSTAFTLGREDVTSFIFFALPVLALVLPAWRAECWLGLVLGMLFTFGALIPTVFGGLFVVLSALAQLVVKPLLRRALSASKPNHP